MKKKFKLSGEDHIKDFFIFRHLGTVQNKHTIKQAGQKETVWK